jgi:Skp family chaperone for outer membrane proteins
MATKAQQNEDGTVSDPVTTETQKGYANYEAELAKMQAEMNSKDAKAKREAEMLMRAGSNLLSRPVQKKAKGGVIKSSASKRADGCAIRGKTKGRMV